MSFITCPHVATLQALVAEAAPFLELAAEYDAASGLDARNELSSDARGAGIASWVERLGDPLVSRKVLGLWLVADCTPGRASVTGLRGGGKRVHGRGRRGATAGGGGAGNGWGHGGGHGGSSAG